MAKYTNKHQVYMQKRMIELAHYIIFNKATVRETGLVFGISKSTVHKDVAERLPKFDYSLGKEVKEVLDYNKLQRHIRGGAKTKEYWKEHWKELAQKEQEQD
ncbi:MAG: sporulation transcriptional regulator SpoIIID [Clostridia bacterium]|jgi:putative DeoR family transcriptional regulator (stage III sporulation protein D)